MCSLELFYYHGEVVSFLFIYGTLCYMIVEMYYYFANMLQKCDYHYVKLEKRIIKVFSPLFSVENTYYQQVNL